MALLGSAGGPAGGLAVLAPRTLAVAGELEQVRAHRVRAVVAGDAVVVVEGREEREAGVGAVDLRDGD